MISAAEGKKGKRGGVREERRLNVFQLFENKQSSVLKYLQGWGWDAGEPTCGGLFLWILGNPLNKTQESLARFFTPFQKGCSFNTRPSGIITFGPKQTKTGQ